MDKPILITIGSDRGFAHRERGVVHRMLQYSVFFEKAYVIVFSVRAHMLPAQVTYEDRVSVYFTNSLNKLLYIWNACMIGRKLKKTIGNKSVVISTQDPFESGLAGLLLSVYLRAPLHVQIHTDIGSTYFQTESFLNRIRMVIARVVLRRASAVRVVSPSVCEYVHRRYNIPRTNISILPIVHTFEALPRIEKENPYILIVSRLEKEKRIDQALLVCKSALMQNASLKIKIAGTGTEEQYLRSYVTNIGIEDRVEFLGHVSVMAPLYAGARVLLHTSLYEGFGLVLYEAMQARCPIVTTNVGIAESLRNAGYDISVCDVENISCLEQNLASTAKMFATSLEPVVLDFMPRSEQEYVELYKDSVVSALTKVI